MPRPSPRAVKPSTHHARPTRSGRGLPLAGAGSSPGAVRSPRRAAPTYPASSRPAPPPPAARPSACARHRGGTGRASARTPPAAASGRPPPPWPCPKHNGGGEDSQAPGGDGAGPAPRLGAGREDRHRPTAQPRRAPRPPCLSP